ncbi:MAG: DUF799 family lipoprotein [Reinekea sp.]
MPRTLIAVLLAVLLTGCVSMPYETNENPLQAFQQVKPHSILVLPVVNNSVDVMAGDSVLTTLPKLLGERGYYVFPVNTVKTLLEYEGFSDAQEIHSAPTEKLVSLFHADSVLYVTIYSWTAQYLVVSTTTQVDLEYVIKDANGNVIFSDRRLVEYTPRDNSTGDFWSDLVSSAITAAIERAAPHYLPLTREANAQAFLYNRYPLPPGPYHPS